MNTDKPPGFQATHQAQRLVTGRNAVLTFLIRVHPCSSVVKSVFNGIVPRAIGNRQSAIDNSPQAIRPHV
jgi:hypothetical protein